MAKLEKVEGIGETYADKLRGIGVASTSALLEEGSTPKGRDRIAEAAGISSKAGPRMGQPCRPLQGQGCRRGICRSAGRSRCGHCP